MPTGKGFPLMNAAALITGAFPKNAAKHLEAELGCSRRQAWRIVSTGRIPSAFRAAALRIIDKALETNRAEIDRLQEELRRLDYEAMVGRAAARRQEALARLADEDAESADRQPLPLVGGGMR